MADDKAPAKTPDTATPTPSGYEFAAGDLDSLGELTDNEAAFLSHYTNPNTERTLAIEVVRLSRKVK